MQASSGSQAASDHGVNNRYAHNHSVSADVVSVALSTAFDTLHEKALYHKMGFVSGDSAQVQPNGSVLSAMKVG